MPGTAKLESAYGLVQIILLLSEFFSSIYFQIAHIRILSIALELACNGG